MSIAVIIARTIAAFWFLLIATPSTTSISGLVTLVIQSITNSNKQKKAAEPTINLDIAKTQTIIIKIEYDY